MKWWWLRLARYALPQWRGLTIAGSLMLLSIAVKLLNPWPLKLIVDHILAHSPLPRSLSWLHALPGGSWPRGQLAWLAAATVGLFLLQQLIMISRKYVEAGTGSRMTYGLASDLFDQLQRCSLLFHGRQRVGDLVKRVTSDTTCSRDLVMGVYLPVITSLITLVSMFWIMLHLSPMLALFAVVMALPLGLVTRRFARPMAEKRYCERELQGQVAALAEQTLTALPIVKAFTRERVEASRFRELTRQTVQANFRAALCEEQFKVSAGAVSSAATAAVMVIGGAFVLRGETSVGTLIVFLTYFGALYAPLETLAYLGRSFAAAGAGARRVMEVLEQEDEGVRDTPGAKPLPVVLPPARRGQIRLENATFGYRPNHPVLRDVSLEASPGELVAIVGHTGAGKSTLVSLLARIYDPWEGRVVLDGVDIRDVCLKSLRSSISIVPQEPFLLPLTVSENIAYGRPNASRRDIVMAAKSAAAHDFIEDLPDGYDTVLGERGATISGGQRQRLSIARALLKNAPLLILDEPSSALDAATESFLRESLEHLMRDRTTIVIAHRLSTVRNASRIVVLGGGRVVESGTHEDLLAIHGAYWGFHQQATRNNQSPNFTRA